MGQEKMRLETKSSLESLESPDKTCLVQSMRALLWILLMVCTWHIAKGTGSVTQRPQSSFNMDDIKP